jgi:hypothetical protein
MLGGEQSRRIGLGQGGHVEIFMGDLENPDFAIMTDINVLYFCWMNCIKLLQEKKNGWLLSVSWETLTGLGKPCPGRRCGKGETNGQGALKTATNLSFILTQTKPKVSFRRRN